MNAKAKIWRENNKEKRRASGKAYRGKNRQKAVEYYKKTSTYASRKKYRALNKKRIKDIQKRYYQEHREQRIEYTQLWYQLNTERRKVYNKAYGKTEQGGQALRKGRAKRRARKVTSQLRILILVKF